jgi:hypothetical protein
MSRIIKWAAVGALFLPLLAVFGLQAFSSGPTSSNPGTVLIDDPGIYSRVLAVSDVHGMYTPLLQLLRENELVDDQSHWAGGKSLLIVIGDSIDKGPQSIEVLDLWIALSSEAAGAGGRVLVLLGNHEAEFLANPTDSNAKASELFAELQAKGIPVRELTDSNFPRGKFLRSLPVAARVGKWLFCHSGFYPAMSWHDFTAKMAELTEHDNYSNELLTGVDSILEAKKWWEIGSNTRTELLSRLKANDFEGVVFGHQPKALNVKGRIAMSEDGRLIKIDNGMAPEGGSHSGSLLLFPDPRELRSNDSGAKPHAFTLENGKRQSIAHESLVEIN